MAVMVAVKKHIVAYPIQAWGHARPLINLVARIVKLRPVHVTLLVTNGFFDRATNELARSFEDEDSEAAKRIRIVSIGGVEFLATDDGANFFENAWRKLIAEEELVCAQTGVRHVALPKPRTVIIDFIGVSAINIARAISGKTVKIYGWFPGLAYSIFHLFGPEKLGGKGNYRIKAEEEAERTGRPYVEVAAKMTFAVHGKVVRIPGMPPMYDYEYHPQDFQIPEGFVAQTYPRVYETIETVMDGLFVCTPESYEPDAVAAVKGWLGETGRPTYICGPLLPSASKTTAKEYERKQSSESIEIQKFLDATLESSGEKSLIYISFGTIFWPVKTPEKLWAFVDVIMEMNVPFILTHASPFAVIPDDVKEKVKVYGKGLLSPWTPQQLILDHPATGWFLTHGGHNSVVEAISAGVPQIFWPSSADQPLNAYHNAANLQVGYELLEVRTGHGIKPIYRTGQAPAGTPEALQAEAREVLAKAFGEDGAGKREKLQTLRKAVTKEWEDGGASKRDVLLFLDSL